MDGKPGALSPLDSLEPAELGDLTPRQRELLIRVRECIGARLESAAVVFFDPKDEGWVASGTFVSFAERFWIVTAKHVVNDVLRRPEARCAWAPTGRIVDYEDRAFRDLAVAAEGAADADIAAILIREDKVSPDVMVPEEQLDPSLKPVTNDDLVYLMGTAAVLRRQVREEHNLANAQTVALFGTHLKNSCAEREHVVNPPGQQRSAWEDYHVDWSRAGMNGGLYRDLFRAGGMSGGALWSANLPDKDDPRVWAKHDARLIGVAWYHDEEHRCVRAVPAGLFHVAARAVVQRGGVRFYDLLSSSINDL